MPLTDDERRALGIPLDARITPLATIRPRSVATPTPEAVAAIVAAVPPGPQAPLPPPLMPPESGPRFVIVEPGTPVHRDERGDLNTGGVLGGAVSDRNAYIAAYPRIHDGHPPIAALAVGERTQATYNLSGSRGTYDIVRVS